METSEITRSARLSRLPDGRGLLKIVMPAKRGPKIVANVTHYVVEDGRPDPVVAWPVYKLIKVDVRSSPCPRSVRWSMSARDGMPTFPGQKYHKQQNWES